MKRRIPLLALALATAMPALAQTAAPPAKPAAPLPLPPSVSKEVREAYDKFASAPPQPDFKGDVAAMRRWNGDQEAVRLRDAERIFPVRTESRTIGGVRVDIVVPLSGISPENRSRVLINLHGGGFMWGAGAGALSEAVPIAGTGRIKVITVDYRMAPEHKFPAASEDVATVYRELLRQYRPENIGIYGCSAGGILAAQSVAWFAAHSLPRPGAIATLCGTGSEIDGDSGYFAAWSTGMPLPSGAEPLHLVGLPYFQGVDPKDPLVFPIVSSDVLRGFPPTLLLAGNRDFAASSLTTMHRRLRASGVDAELYLFDGLWHAFVMDPTLPEAREAYGIVWRFFDRHLGHSK